MVTKTDSPQEILENSKRDYFKFIRPYLFKLFTHLMLLLLSVNSYYQFLSSESSYQDFLNIMDTPVITDVKVIPGDQNCTSPYQEIYTATFPTTKPGCRCDYQVFTNNICQMIFMGLDHSETGKNINNTNCKLQDEMYKMKEKDYLLAQEKKGMNFFNNNTSNLRQLDDMPSIPDTCKCFEFIEPIPEKKNITKWIKDKKICVFRDQQTTTLSYLKSAFEPCDAENRCQNYFCKNNNNASEKCPIVDLYFTNTYSNWETITTTSYNETFIDQYTNENTILLPLLGVHISRNGQCEDGATSLITNYPLVPDVKCSGSQRFYSSSKRSMKDVLNQNDHYYDYLVNKLPLFDMIVTDTNKWTLDLEYSFYRDTLTCLMMNYDPIFGNYTNFEINESTVSAYQAQKISNVLSAFINLNQSNIFLWYIQIFIFVINLLVVSISLMIIIFKFVKILKPVNKKIVNLFNKEIYISFVIDLLIAIFGGISYFILYYYIDFLNELINTSCTDNYVKNSLNSYQNTLQDTAEQNFEMVLIMCIKIVLIFCSIFYYLIVEKCKMNCTKIALIIKENINEGDDPEKDNEDLKEFKRIKTVVLGIKDEDDSEEDSEDQDNSNTNKEGSEIQNGENEPNVEIINQQNDRCINSNFYYSFGISRRITESAKRKESSVQLVPKKNMKDIEENLSIEDDSLQSEESSAGRKGSRDGIKGDSKSHG